MSRCPALLAPLLACSTLLFTGGLAHQASQNPPSAPASFKPQSAPSDATQLLGDVVTLLSAEPSAHGPGIQWLSLNLWQKMDDGENTFEARGRFIRGPNHRLRLEMDLTSLKGAKLIQVCDGVTFWETLQIGTDKPVLSLYPVPLDAAEKQCFFEDKTIPDIRPLLARLRGGLEKPTQQRGVWRDVPAIRISGTWKPNEAAPRELRSPLRPRVCHLYLEARTRWPFRIEWWGAQGPFDPLVLLLEIEFRDTVINQPPSAQETARLFAALVPEQ